MIVASQAELLLKNLSAAEGEELTFDQQGDCSLISPEQRLIHIHYNAELGEIQLYGVVGELPEDESLSHALLRNFMINNFMWLDSLGSTFALEPENNYIILQKIYNDNEPNDKSFRIAIDKFDFELCYWMERFLSLPGEIEEEAEENSLGMLSV